MSIAGIEDILGPQMQKATAAVDLAMKGDPSDPATMYKIQTAVSQYSIFNSLMSSIVKNVKDLAMGIIQKI